MHKGRPQKHLLPQHIIWLPPGWLLNNISEKKINQLILKQLFHLIICADHLGSHRVTTANSWRRRLSGVKSAHTLHPQLHSCGLPPPTTPPPAVLGPLPFQRPQIHFLLSLSPESIAPCKHPIRALIDSEPSTHTAALGTGTLQAPGSVLHFTAVPVLAWEGGWTQRRLQGSLRAGCRPWCSAPSPTPCPSPRLTRSETPKPEALPTSHFPQGPASGCSSGQRAVWWRRQASTPGISHPLLLRAA